MAGSLRALPADAGLPRLLAALRAALDGTGPALLPLPAAPAEADRVRRALRPDEPLERDDTALVVATSGSTGEPKGVLLPARALLASAEATLQRLGGPGSWLLAVPVTHIAGMQVLIRSVVAGNPPQALPAGAFTAAGFVAASARVAPGRRYTALVPTQLRRLLAAGGAAAQALAGYDAVLVGGAAADAGLLAEASAAGVRVVTTYGMSETSGGCVYDGAPLDGVSVTVDEEQRIGLSGAVLASGYRLRPDLTDAVFRDGGFRTTDAGAFDPQGRLVVLGRLDDLVVTGGEKVAPAAVEAVLARHPSVEEVAVVGVADAEWGQRVVAGVVLRPGRALTLEQARAHVEAGLSRAAAPRELRVLAALPLLASGKLDRAALRSAHSR